VRILFCCPAPVDARLGVAKHYLELAESFRRIGWDATVVGPDEVDGGHPGSAGPAAESSRLRAYLRDQAARYDVVEFDISRLPYPRDDFSPQTLLVARCMILAHHFRTTPIPPLPRLRSRVGHLLMARDRRRAMDNLIDRANRTVREADLTVVSNDRDAAVLVQDGADPTRLAVFPLGLTVARRRQFDAVPAELPAHPVVGFIGTFDPRKGLCEFPALVDRVARRVPGVTFRLLGTAGMVPDADGLRGYFPRRLRPRLELYPRYEPNELPGLLAGVSVGVFPSRVESFGYGILEMLAAAVPVIAYDAPGPHVMLPPVYRVPIGDVRAMADLICDLLTDPDRLRAARLWARARAADFRWEEIATQTAKAYAWSLAVLRGADE
jgi:glycosyltransferase involved in cell wall biosynthesis